MLSAKKNPVADMLRLFDDYKRVVAKCMAREDITVQVVDGAPTAWFDPVRRVLTLPKYAGLTEDQIDTLTGHEVGHALFTDNTYAAEIAKRPDLHGFSTYFNIIEDARIERKMRECYPGMQRVFYNGYEQFFANGPIMRGNAKGLINRNGQFLPFSKMKLIDRINCWYKIGAFATVPFSKDEQQWLRRIDLCPSMEDAAKIAEELHKLACEHPEDQTPQQQMRNEQQASQNKQQSADDQQGEDESRASGEGDEDGQDENESENESQATGKGDEDEADDEDETEGQASGKGDEDEIEGGEDSEGGADEGEDGAADADDSDGASETGNQPPPDRNLDGAKDDDVAETADDIAEALKALASQTTASDVQVRNILCAPLPAGVVAARTVRATVYANQVHERLRSFSSYERMLDMLEADWQAQFGATAKHMAQEFELRKNAQQQMRARVSRTGRLDMDRLHAFRFTDDVFRRTMTVPMGKSHGVVMLVDGSESMAEQFANVIDQMLLFAFFAYQVNIPFEAYMFTTAGVSPENSVNSTGLYTLALPTVGRLIGLIDTNTDRVGFKRQVRAALALQSAHRPAGATSESFRDACLRLPYTKLGMTPLFAGLMIVERHLARMKQTRRLDKTTLVVVSDGGDCEPPLYEVETLNHYGIVKRSYETFGSYANGKALVIRDTVTKRTFVLAQTVKMQDREVAVFPTNGGLTFFFDLFKARHDTRGVFIYLTKGGGKLEEALMMGTRMMTRRDKSDHDAMAEFERDGQYTLTTESVADVSIIVKANNLRLAENDFANMNTQNMDAKTIGQEFVKSMRRAMSNRVFVKTVMPVLV